MSEASKPTPLTAAQQALVQLGRWLQEQRYTFITPTPATHQRVNARAGNELAHDLRGVFGWSRAFHAELVPEVVLRWLEEAGALTRDDGRLRSGVRFSSLDTLTLVHSAFPTDEDDSVFFGPDTYRFVRWVQSTLDTARWQPDDVVVDLGCGSGACGIALATRANPPPRVILADISERALLMAGVNAVLNGTPQVELVRGDMLEKITEPLRCVLANPPYMADPRKRRYRDGGEGMGSEFAVRLVREVLPRLTEDGRLLLYTGAAVVEGNDLLRDAIEPLLRVANKTVCYQELDPDVFGEELDQPAYRSVERIAAVAVDVRGEPRPRP